LAAGRCIALRCSSVGCRYRVSRGRVIVGAPRERHLFDGSLEQVAQAFDVPNGLAGIAHRDELHPDRRSYVIGPLGMGIVEFMARYIDAILQPEEKVLYSTNAHWTFYVPAIVTWGC
jgi:hypothetical protein